MATESKLPPDVTPSIWQGTDDERKKMQRDTSDLTRYELYKAPFKQHMIDGVRRYSLKANPLADKRISNVLIPLMRMVADTGITNMSAGSPSFNVKPRALSDYPKVNILKPAIDQVLEETDFQAALDTFITDGTVMGTAGLEVATQIPQRKDENGKAVRDFSRPRIVIRPRSGMEMSFDPSMPNHQKKGGIYWEDRISYDAFEEEYKIVQLSDGTLKYKNCDAVAPGMRASINPNGLVMMRAAGMYDYKGVVIGHKQDPLQNFYRIYANNIPIFDTPLYMRRRKDGTHADGDNALGDTRIAVWTNNDMYDDNDATHALYGGGDGWLTWGLDRMYQDFGNMMVDNYALANTFALSYNPTGLHAGGIDLDTTDFYSGMFIQGDIIKTSFGEVQLKDYQAIKDIIDEWCIEITGGNFKSIIGENGATAFEVATKIRSSNKRYQYKLKRLEDTVFKKLGKLVVAAIFTTYTVPDFELVTGEDRQTLADKFAAGDIAEDDLEFTDVNGNKMITAVKHRTMIKIPGKVYSEKLGSDKKRKLDGSMDSTLSEDIEKRGTADSFVAGAEEYLVTLDYTERGAIPGISVDTGTMIAGKQQLDMSDLSQLTQYAQVRAQMAVAAPQDESVQTNFDFKKMDERMVELLNFTPEAVMKDDTQNAEDAKQIKGIDDTLSMMEQAMKSSTPSPLTNATTQSSSTQIPVQAGQAPALGGGSTPATPPAGTIPQNANLQAAAR